MWRGDTQDSGPGFASITLGWAAVRARAGDRDGARAKLREARELGVQDLEVALYPELVALGGAPSP
jgi:hypothetical protein